VLGKNPSGGACLKALKNSKTEQLSGLFEALTEVYSL